MEEQEARTRFSEARVGRLATTGGDGPHLVPIVFATEGDTLFTAVDAKPKRSRRLRRLANIESNPAVAVLVDHYEEAWERLWWVRADGIASVLHDETDMARGLDLLTARYEQYRISRPAGPVIEIAIVKWTGWRADA